MQVISSSNTGGINDIIYCHVYECDHIQGLDWRLDLLTALTHDSLTILNYSAITNLRTLQITTACAKSLQSAVYSPVVPW
jgi:hypothetical protein